MKQLETSETKNKMGKIKKGLSVIPIKIHTHKYSAVFIIDKHNIKVARVNSEDEADKLRIGRFKKFNFVKLQLYFSENNKIYKEIVY